MILQALTACYEALAKKDKVPLDGWMKIRVSYALELGDDGELLAVHSLKRQETRKEKTVFVPREIILPAQVKRTVGIAPNFLCDKASYMLGLAQGDDRQRARKCFESAAELHRSMLCDIHTPATAALLGFFETYNPDSPPDCIKESSDELADNANMVFMHGGKFIHDEPYIKEIWQKHYDTAGSSGKMVCLVTGELTVPMQTHPPIKGVKDAQSSGAALVSFNAPADESYGHTQNLNAPVGKYASFAYTTALNYLIADRTHTRIIGDSTIVYWAENAEPAYQDLYNWYTAGESKTISDDDLRYAIKELSCGRTISQNGSVLDPGNNFYILALSPNAARLSVRMFLKNSFGNVIKNISEHYERLRIAGAYESIPLWRLLSETVLKVSGKSGAPSPQMSGDTLRAILTNGYYPATLYEQIQLRIRADRDINGIRAAVIKAYLLKNTDSEIYKEVIKVELNENTTYAPYILGRLFAVYEQIQEKANPGINTTIKDKYFSSACATPASVFPTIMNLSEKHLRKLDSGSRIYCEKLRAQLLSLITESFPVHLSLYDQGIFQLGYYHQRQKRFEKKEYTINNNNEEEA